MVKVVNFVFFVIFSYSLFMINVSAGVAGSRDLSFINAVDNSYVRSVAVQSDGKILIAGDFTSYGGVARGGVARLNSDGSLDTSFVVTTGVNSGFSPKIYKILIQSDGKIIIGGGFKTYNGVARGGIARLNTNGSLDTTFLSSGAGATSTVNTIGVVTDMAIQSDGKILIVGHFTHYNGTARKTVARLTTTGALDTSFVPASITYGEATALGLLANGDIIIGGNIGTIGGYTKGCIAKLSSSGALYTSFPSGGSGANYDVDYIVPQSDGKILIGGPFSTYNGVSRRGFARINSNGSSDTAFNSGIGTSSAVEVIQIQSDGKIIIGGAFSSYNGVSKARLARVNTDGTLDTSFLYGINGPNNYVYGLGIQSDGKIIVGGSFTQYNNEDVLYLTRIEGEDTGYKINSLNLSLGSYLSSDWTSDVASILQTGVKNIGISKSNSKIVSFDVDFSSNRDWINVIADTDSGKSVFGYTGGNYTNIPGKNSSTYTLYVPKSLVGMRVGFCPEAVNLSDISVTCNNLKFIESGTSELIGSDTVSVNVGTNSYSGYWVVTGLSVGIGAFDSDGYIASGAPPSVILLTDVNGESTDVTTISLSGLKNVEIKSTETTNLIADMDIDFSNDLVLNSITAGNNATSAFFHSSSPITTLTNGGSISYTLYVPKGEGDKVWICPGADSLVEVSLYCSGGYFLSEGQTSNGATASVVTKDSIVYWKIDGLTGTGGMSVITGLRDILSRLKVGTPSDHTIIFGTNYGMAVGTGYTMVVEFPDFDLSSLAITDIELTDNVGVTRTLASSAGADTWGAVINTGAKTITFTVPTSGTGGYAAATQIVIKIGLNATGGANQIVNPSSTGSFKEIITLNNTSPGEQGTVDIPIVDSDTIDVTGYVTAYIHFDIDTNTDNSDCAFDVCPVHGGIGAAEGDNYTVDLGELTSALVNKSNSISVVHSDTINGKINSIYFDLTSNAPGGVVVSVKSLNSGLKGPGTNMINSVTDGLDIAANSGLYGYNLTTGTTQKHGTVFPNISCDTSVEFCGPSSTPKTVFDTNNLPVDSARVRMDLAAAAAYTNNPGVYTDTLTFVATGTF
jgi:uncharacterized delta-60 repeat protein